MESDFGIVSPIIRIIGSISYEYIPEELLDSLKRKMNSARRLLILEGKRYIDKIVPKDSGALRKSMIKTLEMGRVTNDKYTLFIGSPVKEIGKYMNIVNENYMEKRLAHTGQKYYRKGKRREIRPEGVSHATRKILYDPKAKKRFIESITRKMLRSMERHLNSIKRQIRIEADRLHLNTDELEEWIKMESG